MHAYAPSHGAEAATRSSWTWLTAIFESRTLAGAIDLAAAYRAVCKVEELVT